MDSSREPSKIPEIFRDPDGSQWSVFVEAAGITGRPGIIRNLRKAGATICSDPNKAQVILVDSNSSEGKLFIHDWGSDPNKVVLDYHWVNDSIGASKALGQENDWGGHHKVDNGLPIAIPNQEGDSPLNSLPTPRITPIEVAAVEHVSSTQPPTPSSTTKKALQPVQSVQNLSRQPLDVQSSSLTDIFQHLPPQTMATFMAQAQAMMQQYPSPNLNNGLLGSGIGNTPPQPMLNFNQPIFPLLSQGMGSWNISPPQNFTIPLFNPQMMNWCNSSQLQQLSPIGSIPAADTSGTHPEISAFSPSISTSNGDDGESKPTVPMRRSPSAQSQSVPHPTPRSSSTLFTSKKGKELLFFVQVDLKNRSKIVTAIKKHSGIISASNTSADYAILYSRSKTFNHLLRSTSAAGTPAISANFVHDCIEQGKVLDTSAYEFETPKGASRGKRKLVEIEDGDSVTESKRLEKGHREKGRRVSTENRSSPLRKKSITVNDAPLPFQGSQDVSGQISNARSPTPPPPHTRLPRSGGDGFMYTDHERDYCVRYVKALLERDHNISTSAIAKALYTKMDYHSLGSWRTFLAQQFATELETMRKKAGIAYRTTQNARARQAQREVFDDAQLKREIDTVAHFFATGGGKQATDNVEEEDESDIWTRLSAQTECRMAENWEAFYATHYDEVKKRYGELTETLESISA